jgi:hypothetical protein
MLPQSLMVFPFTVTRTNRALAGVNVYDSRLLVVPLLMPLVAVENVSRLWTEKRRSYCGACCLGTRRR